MASTVKSVQAPSVPDGSRGLLDVNSDLPQDGQVLKWDAALQTYRPQPDGATGAALDDLTDVVAVPATNGDILRYNTLDSEWQLDGGNVRTDVTVAAQYAIPSYADTTGKTLLETAVTASPAGGSWHFGVNGLADPGCAVWVTSPVDADKLLCVAPVVSSTADMVEILDGSGARVFAIRPGGDVQRDKAGAFPIEHTAAGGSIELRANGKDAAVVSEGGVRVGETGGALDASAVLEAYSKTQGALLPRMTAVQRDAIAAPATGLIVYNENTNRLNWYDGAQWQAVEFIGHTHTLADITDSGTAAAANTGTGAGNVPTIGGALGGNTTVETDGAGALISAIKNTGYNLPLGTAASTVAEGNHTHPPADITGGVKDQILQHDGANYAPTMPNVAILHSNAGLTGVSILEGTTGNSQFDFRSIGVAASGKLSVALDAPNKSVELDLASVDATDITATGQVNGSLLQYNGANWVVTTLASATADRAQLWSDASAGATTTALANTWYDAVLDFGIDNLLTNFQTTAFAGELKYVGGGGVFNFQYTVGIERAAGAASVTYKVGFAINGNDLAVGAMPFTTDAAGSAESGTVQTLVQLNTNDLIRLRVQSVGHTDNPEFTSYNALIIPAS
jgi:hypothetical protein